MKPIRKALTFRASSIGDCLMGKYLLENVYAEFPNARLGIVVAGRAAMVRDLFAVYSWLEVIEASRRNPRALWNLWRQWRGSDLVVTQYAGKQGGIFSFASKLAARVLARRGALIGFTDASALNHFLYSRLVPFDGAVAPAELERRALLAAGVPVSLPYPTLRHISEPHTPARYGLTAEKYVLVHLFSGSKKRGLSPANRCLLVNALSRALPPHIDIILTGTGGEKAEATDAAEGTKAKILAGQATLQEMMGLIEESRGVVAVDTGIAHITAQLNKPLVVLSSCLGLHWWNKEQYGISAPIQRFNCSDPVCVAGHVSKDYPDCLNMINFASVAEALRAMTAEK